MTMGSARFLFIAREPSHVARGAQALEGVLGLLVLRASGALGDGGALELGNNIVDAGGRTRHGAGAGRAAERAIAPPVAREIEIDHRDRLAPHIAPDVELGPMQQRVDAEMDAGRELGVEMVPELRRLVAEIPLRVLRARAEDALLGARALL